MTSEYTQVPPILIQKGDRWYVEVVKGNTIIRAPIGPRFAQGVWEKIVLPALEEYSASVSPINLSRAEAPKDQPG